MTKFKVGDTVRCIDIQGHPVQLDRVHGAGWTKGKIFKIFHISNQHCKEPGNSLSMPIYWAENQYGVYEHALELVEKPIVKPYGICDFVTKYYK